MGDFESLRLRRRRSEGDESLRLERWLSGDGERLLLLDGRRVLMLSQGGGDGGSGEMLLSNLFDSIVGQLPLGATLEPPPCLLATYKDRNCLL